MAEYAFLTTWVVEADVEPVWRAIETAEEWPEWWRGVERVTKREHGDDDGVGGVYVNVWRSRIPYAVEFVATITRVERPHLIEVRAEGGLTGTGTWRLFDGGGTTAVTYEWRVRTTKPWMNAVAPLGRPLFAWNHHAVMKQGGVGLARLLDARLLAQASG